MENKVTSIYVDGIVDLSDLDKIQYMVVLKHGRKKKDRKRFPHIFNDPEIAANMVAALEIEKGKSYEDFCQSETVKNVVNQFAPLASNYRKKEAPRVASIFKK